MHAGAMPCDGFDVAVLLLSVFDICGCSVCPLNCVEGVSEVEFLAASALLLLLMLRVAVVCVLFLG